MSLLKSALPTVNGALRGVRLLVLTESLSLGTETAEAWREMGLPACAVVGDARQAARLLPTLLTIRKLPAAVIVYPSGTGKQGLCNIGPSRTKVMRLCRQLYSFHLILSNMVSILFILLNFVLKRIFLSLDCRIALGAPAFRPVQAETVDILRADGKTLVEIPSLAPRLRWRHHRLEPLPLFTAFGPVLSPDFIKETASGLLSPILVGDGSKLTAEEFAQVRKCKRCCQCEVQLQRLALSEITTKYWRSGLPI